MAVDVHSGLAGITHWLNNMLASSGFGNVKFTKTDEVVRKMKEIVDSIYNDGRNTTMSNEELASILHQVSPETAKHDQISATAKRITLCSRINIFKKKRSGNAASLLLFCIIRCYSFFAASITFCAIAAGTSSYRSTRNVNRPRPCVIARSAMT